MPSELFLVGLYFKMNPNREDESKSKKKKAVL